MNAITYVLVDVPPFIVMGILYVNSLVRLPYLRENSLLRTVILSTMGALVAGMLAWVLDGRLPVEALYAVNVLHFLFMGGIAFSWFLYVRYLVHGESLLCKPLALAIACAPYAAFAVAVLCAPWTHGVFYVDEGLVYRRGPLSFVPFAAGALTFWRPPRSRSFIARRRKGPLAGAACCTWRRSPSARSSAARCKRRFRAWTPCFPASPSPSCSPTCRSSATSWRSTG